jgi:hypothetical protein
LIDNDGNDPVTGHFLNLPEGGLAARFADNDLIITYHGGDGNDVEVYAVPAVSMRRFAVGEGAGGTPTVHVYDGNGQVIRSFIAYESTFHGGVHVATGDVNGDGVPDVITAPGVGGGPVIRVWDGITGLMVKQFNAYDPNFRGGASVAFAANWIITGAGPGGGPHVKVFNPVSGTVLFSFMAYDPSFTGGVSVAGLDEGSNGHIVIPAQVITGAGPGGGPHVKVFSLRDFPGTVTEIGSFMAYDPAFRGGVNVAAHGSPAGAPDFQGLITSPASNGGPDVRSYDLYGRRLGGLLAYDPHFFGGVTVAFLPTGPNDAIELITGAGSGGGPHVKVISSANGTRVVRLSFLAFDPGFTGGIYVG